MHHHRLVSRLNAYWPLKAPDRNRLLELMHRPPRTVPAGSILVEQGSIPEVIFGLVEGWAIRYKMLEDGRRQIVGLLFPGEVCDPYCILLHRADHAISALSRCLIVEISRARLESVVLDSPEVMKTFWVQALVTASIHREWCVNLGQRTALERIGHLICEIYFRTMFGGDFCDDGFYMPLTQSELADATGLTTVHVNRTLQQLRGLGLIELQRKRLKVRRPAELRRISLFDPLYLTPRPVEPTGAD